MKTIVFFVVTFITTTLLAQTPEALKYQAVVRDQNGNLLENREVSFKVSIIKGTENGVAVFSEQQLCTTNNFGLIDLEIGAGNLLFGNFSDINWSGDKYYIKLEMDPSGGSSFELLGVSRLLSVPYALFAKNAGNGFSGNYNDLVNVPSFSQVAVSGNYNDLLNKPVTDGSETKITAGKNMEVTGNGTLEKPYLFNSVPDHYIGELYGGGVVFYVDHTGEHGLIVSMIDITTEIWSNVYDSIGIAAASPWDGKANTEAIIKQAGHIKSAAKKCDDYTNAEYGTGIFSDWYLPAINELSLLYSNAFEVNKKLATDNNNTTVSLFYKPYWSSTENWNIYARSYAFFFNFETFVNASYSKTNPLVVRAIRSF